MSVLTKVKWVSSNFPMVIVNRNDSRLYLTKRELVELKTEIEDFIAFYADDFEEPNIDYGIYEEEFDFKFNNEGIEP